MTQGEMFSDLALEEQYDNMIKELGMKQTAVQWFASKVMYLKISPSEMHEFLEWFEEAKEIEKNQIKDAFKTGDFENTKVYSAEDYYKETYGKDG